MTLRDDDDVDDIGEAARPVNTSLAAWESIQEVQASIESCILNEILCANSAGLTCDEIEQALDLKHQTASAAIRHLREKDFVYDTGRRRPTRSGRAAIVWMPRLPSEPQGVDPDNPSLDDLRAGGAELLRLISWARENSREVSKTAEVAAMWLVRRYTRTK